MKVILDTNIYISSLLFRGKAQTVYDFCVLNADIFISDFIISEVFETLTIKFDQPQANARRITRSILKVSTRIFTTGNLPVVCKDADDNNILLLAQTVRANFIVTGDKNLLNLKVYKNVKIISLTDFIERFIE